MKKLLIQNPWLNVPVLVLFVLASSGFTTVLHECSIQPKMACCEAPDSMPQHCSEPAVPAGPSFQSDQFCHTNLLLGGLQTAPAVSESPLRSVGRAGMITAVHATAPAYDIHPSSSSVLFSSPQVTPPGIARDRSILFSSLLI